MFIQHPDLTIPPHNQQHRQENCSLTLRWGGSSGEKAWRGRRLTALQQDQGPVLSNYTVAYSHP